MTTNPVAQLAARFQQAPRALDANIKTGVAKAAKTLQVSVAAASGGYAASPLARTRAYVRPASALVAMTSRKAHLLDRDTRPHPESPRARSGRRALARSGFGPVAAVNHPGTKGKHMWERGLAAARPAIDRDVADGAMRALQQVFGR